MRLASTYRAARKHEAKAARIPWRNVPHRKIAIRAPENGKGISFPLKAVAGGVRLVPDPQNRMGWIMERGQ
jgi:hypothetical protein